MSLILKPSLKIDNIQMELDPGISDRISMFTNETGRNIPIIKIGDFVLDLGSLKEFTLKVAFNCFPSFTMEIKDDQYAIRKALKNQIDTCVIFIGYSNWYLKFNGLICSSFSEQGDEDITLTGIVFNQKLFDGKQTGYKDKTVRDIFTDICKKTSMGLFVYENSYLDKKLDYSINPGKGSLDYFEFILKNYTNNIYSIDPNYYFHVGNIESIRKQKIDKYSLNWKTGESIGEQDIIFKSKKMDGDDETEDYKIPIDFYTFDTNFSEVHKNTYNTYNLGYGGHNEVPVDSLKTLGIGTNKTNTFFGFKDHKFPFYTDVINKSLAGNIIKLTLKNPIIELNPLSLVRTEIYLPFTSGQDITLDEEHSGDKVVLGYEISFLRESKELNKLQQKIFLI